jgi:hypothetical protein
MQSINESTKQRGDTHRNFGDHERESKSGQADIEIVRDACKKWWCVAETSV